MCDDYVEELNRNLTNNLFKARLIAQFAHAGQVDKAGKPYFLHVERVSKAVGDLISDWHQPATAFFLKARIVGYLHDVLEDTEITVSDLQAHGIPSDCILAIETITHVKNVSYQDYLEKVKSCKLSSVVKIADMMHNSDLSRLDQITEEDLMRREKYLKAIEFLSEFPCE